MLVVVAGVVIREGRVMLCQRRAEAHNGLKWEFPGGKIEPGETPQQALCREILEELDTRIRVEELLTCVEYDYPTFHLHMACYFASVVEGSLRLKEHAAARWLSKQELGSVAWLPPDREIAALLQAGLAAPNEPE